VPCDTPEKVIQLSKIELVLANKFPGEEELMELIFKFLEQGDATFESLISSG